MKKQIRHGVFETNSSSTHSLTICSKEKFEAWKRGEVLFDQWSEDFIETVELTNDQKIDAKDDYEDRKETFWKDWNSLTEKEKEKWYSKYAKENELNNTEECKTYDEWCDDDYLEIFVREHTTDKGEQIVAFGKYGYDG